MVQTGKILPSCKVNNMAADVLATQGARASAANVLTFVYPGLGILIFC